jgi:hypothetical protein
VLYDDRLNYYKAPSDTTPLGVIPLDKYVYRSSIHTQTHTNMSVSSPVLDTYQTTSITALVERLVGLVN